MTFEYLKLILLVKLKYLFLCHLNNTRGVNWVIQIPTKIETTIHNTNYHNLTITDIVGKLKRWGWKNKHYNFYMFYITCYVHVSINSILRIPHQALYFEASKTSTINFKCINKHFTKLRCISHTYSCKCFSCLQSLNWKITMKFTKNVLFTIVYK